MKQTLIKITDDHYVVVDDSEIKEGDYYIKFTESSIEIFIEIFKYRLPSSGQFCKKITHSTQPNKEMENVTFISPKEVKELIGEVDVEKKAEKFIGCKYDDIEDSIDQIGYDSFIRGYNQALEDNKEKKYTEEDMRLIFASGYLDGVNKRHYSKDMEDTTMDYFQPKTQWEVTFDEQGKLRLV